MESVSRATPRIGLPSQSGSGVIRREQFEPLDLDAIRHAHSLSDVVAAVVPLKRSGRELIACCPFHQEKTPSFTIYDGGRRFQCFGCGAGGDVFDFMQRLHGVGLREAAYLLSGGEIPTAPAIPVLVPDGEDRTEEARVIWNSSVPGQGTLAEAYLRSRKLQLPIPESIRFTRLRYGRKGAQHPVLVAAVNDERGELIGIQRTFLNAAGTGKAAVPKPKLSLGRVSCGAIRLSAPGARLVVCEGLEDGLSLRQDLGVAVWVAAGASMLPAMKFPPEVRSVAIGGDNDEAGRTSAAQAAEAFALRGLEVRVFYPPPPHKDFNEQLQSGARA